MRLKRRTSVAAPGAGASLPPIRPNVGLQMLYEGRLTLMVDSMAADVSAAVLRQYAATPPIAQDASPAVALRNTLSGLTRTWLDRFNLAAPEMAKWFATHARDRVDRVLMDTLRNAGITVRLRRTAAQREVVQAAVAENVTLIKSIASEHLSQVEGLVMRSVQEGRALHVVQEGLTQRLDVTRRRAARIALDQNNKATAMLHRQRQVELGLKAVWLHSAGGKEPRPSHVAQSGKEYDPKTGWYDPDAKEWIWPGSLIGCRCVSRSIVPGFD